MSDWPFRRRYAIVGIGETELGKLGDVTTMTLHVEAVKRALADAGLAPGDVDGLLANQPLHDAHRSYSTMVAHAAGITPNYVTDLALGGATPVSMVQHAVMAIDAGLCHTVVCVHARNNASMASVKKKDSPVRDGPEEFEEPFGLVGAVASHAAAASRHMYEFGTTHEQLAAVAVAARKHALLNPMATMRKPLSIEDCLASRWVIRPLHLTDCCLVSDGGGAFVVTTEERAKNLRKPPVYVLGMGSHSPHPDLMRAPTLTTLGGKKSSERAYKMAGLGPKDMNFAQIYDCFTITTLITLEDYGFCPKGEGGPWIAGGSIEIGGELPVNTHGGLLSQAHVEGMLHVTEAVKQLRGSEVEPARQVPNAEVGVVSGHGGGGLSTHATLILGNRPN